MSYFEANAKILEQIREKRAKIEHRDPFEPARSDLEKHKDELAPGQGAAIAQQGNLTVQQWEDQTAFIRYLLLVQDCEEIVDAAKSIAISLKLCPLQNPNLSSTDVLDSGFDEILICFNAMEKLLRLGHSEDPKGVRFEEAAQNLQQKIQSKVFRQAIGVTLAEELLGNSLTVYQDQMKKAFDDAFAARDELERSVENAKGFLQSSTNAINSALALAREDHSNVKDVLASLGTRAQAVRFQKEADEQHKAGIRWLSASSVILVLLMLYVGCLVGAVVPGHTLGEVLPATLARLTIVTLSSVALAVTLRNYAACRHNMTVNRHRQHALNTFDYFATAASQDPDTKNAVLLEATKVIFTPVNTGYLKAAQDSPGGMNVLEIVKHISSKPEGG